jgi:hypothetical protein
MASHVAATGRLRESTARPHRWGWIELFVVIQFLSGGLFFLPGAQSVRGFIRGLPYASSLGFMILYFKRSPRSRLPAGSMFILLALGLLVLNLLHATTQLTAGLAQCVFQLSIAAPVFWAHRAVDSQMRLRNLVWLIFFANAMSAGIGLLQVYYPEQFMPPEFSRLALSLNPNAVEALTYTGAYGQRIVRPTGLSDLPGGAAIAGMVTGVLGIALGVRAGQKKFRRLLCLAIAGVGMVTLYLTLVRSLVIMMLIALAALCILAARQGRGAESRLVAVTSAIVVGASFIFATSIGGEHLADRFLGLAEEGLIMTYEQNRGHFVKYTMNELMYEFPLGAGLGRWGMMQIYFGDDDIWRSPPIHVEIQLTGWLLDGGVLMWLLYGAAVLAAMRYAYRLAVSRADPMLAYLARIVFCSNLMVLGMSMAGPAFNTQLGIQFWFLTAALHGAASQDRHRIHEVRLNARRIG